MSEPTEQIELNTLESENSNLKEPERPQKHAHNGRECGHNHSGDSSSQHPRKQRQILTPFLFYNFMVANHYVFMWVYLSAILVPQEYYLTLISFNFLTFMTQFSYYVAVTTNNKVGHKNMFVREIQQTVEMFGQPKPCEECQVIKIPRINHCSTCGQCQNRMDHHCPWILNCVGQRNHKAFLLYNIYLFLSISQNLYCGYYYHLYLKYDYQYEQSSIIFVTYWYMFFAMTTLIGLWVSMLGGMHFLLMVSNVTSLEQMKGFNLRCIDFSKYKRINIFDQGIIANIVYFLDNRYFLWWYPTINYQFNDGYGIPRNPAVTKSQQMDYKKKLNPQLAQVKIIDYKEELEKMKEKKAVILQHEGKLIKL